MLYNRAMKTIAKISLEADGIGKQRLLQTMEAFNAACDDIAVVCFKEHSASKFSIQKLVYHDIRKKHNLSAQLCIRAISKTCEAYKRDKNVQPKFRKYGSITYDVRILTFKGLNSDFPQVSLTTLDGRRSYEVSIRAYFASRTDRINGQVDLVYRGDKFFLYATCDMPEGTPIEPDDVLGVDMGVVNIAVDSTRVAKRQSSLSRKTVIGFICRICGEDKSPDKYNVDVKMRTGYSSNCRDCCKKIGLNHYYKNHQLISERRKRLYHADPQKYIEQRVKSQARYPEKALERARAYRLKRPGFSKIINHTRRARMIAAPGVFTNEDIQKIFHRQRGRCFWCDEKTGQKFVVDHVIPVARGGANYPENLVVSCRSCNSRKSNKYPTEWFYGPTGRSEYIEKIRSRFVRKAGQVRRYTPGSRQHQFTQRKKS